MGLNRDCSNVPVSIINYSFSVSCGCYVVITCNFINMPVQVMIKLLNTVLPNVEVRQFFLLYNM